MLMIVWDEPKRQKNLAKHSLDFADLDQGFFLGSLVVPAKDGQARRLGQSATGPFRHHDPLCGSPPRVYAGPAPRRADMRLAMEEPR